MNNLVKIDDYIFSLIPGPEHVDWTSDSQYLNEKAEYDVNEIFECLSVYQNIEIKNNSNDVYERRLIWKKENRYIEISFSTLDNDNIWGGSGLVGECNFMDILELWKYLKSLYPRVWLHDRDCTIYSPEAFDAAFIKG